MDSGQSCQFSIVNYQLVQRIQEADGKFIPGRLVLRQLEVGQLDEMQVKLHHLRSKLFVILREGVEIPVRGRDGALAAGVLRDERGFDAMKRRRRFRQATSIAR